ncbi:MAG: OmpA family protein [Betaproteobacteria bacterium]|nr:OmpA family protein [Betaproteobacteria bacterium]
MSRTLLKLLALSGLLMTSSAFADSGTEPLDTRIYFAPSVTVNALDNNWRAGNGMGVDVGVGKALSEHWNIELNTDYTESQYSSGSNSLRTNDTSLDAMYFFNRNPAFSPFVEAGAGALYASGTVNSGTYAEGNIGIGFMHWINDIAIRADIRDRFASSVNNNISVPGATGSFQPNDWIARVGLIIPLGSKPAAPAPAPAPVAAAPVEAPAPAPVAEVVEIVRPAAHTKLVLDGTHFDFNKSTLRPEGKGKLDEDAKMLNAYPDIHVKISGYTDSIGTAKYNLKLSKARAATVAKYLESKGIAADRLTEEGYGEASPVASNKTAAGRAKNRRVEIETLN